jgi:type II secretion system protein J
VALLRGNWLNPDDQLSRSSLERVRYCITEHSLVRESVADIPLQQQAYVNRVTLLSGITQFRLRFAENGRWTDGWHSGMQLPEAIEITLDHPSLGSVSRIMLTGGRR